MSSILIVEDSPDNMKLFSTLLRLKGHEVEELRTQATAGIAAGFDGYISKPIDIRNFPDQVARALAGKDPLSD